MTFKLANQLLKQVKRIDKSPLLKFNNGSQFFVLPLSRITINFSETMVDSQGIRDFLLSPKFQQFVQEHPSVEFVVEPREGKRPLFRALYNMSGAPPAGQARRERPLCVANLDVDSIFEILNTLRDDGGKVRRRFHPKVHSDTPAVRPIWSPFHDNVEHNNALHRLKQVVAERKAEEDAQLAKSLAKLPLSSSQNPTIKRDSGELVANQ